MNETKKSSDNVITRKPLRYVLHVDERGSVLFDFEHDEVNNPGQAAYKMAKLLIMMYEGDIHELVVDGLRNRAMQGDQIADLTLQHYLNMYRGGADDPCVTPRDIFDVRKVKNGT